MSGDRVRPYATLVTGRLNDPSDIELRAQERVGSVLNGKWTLDSLLGIGGMAAVYAATHRNNKRGAIKILHPELSTDKFIRERFLREGYIANTVEHPGAVSVNDDDLAEDGSAYLVMDLLEGESLKDHWAAAGYRLGAEETLELTHQLLDTLEAAHAKGILHRDIKPENLFLTNDHRLKVLDFGIARLRQHDRGTPTQTGDLMGTPSFMSPEQARGRWSEVDQRSDLWAVGAVMYTMLTGELVHDAETVPEALVKAVTEPVPSVAERVPELAPVVTALVDRALAFDKRDRFEDAASMKKAVALAYHELTGEELHSQVIPAARRSNDGERPAPTPAERREAAAESAALLGTPTAGGVSSVVPKKETSFTPWALLAAVVLVAAGVGAVWVNSNSSEGASDERAGPEASEAPEADVLAPATRPAASDVGSTSASTQPSASASAEAAEPSASAAPAIAAPKPQPQPVRKPAPAPTPAPRPTVDPLDRRR